jgi:hypothetical protein
MVAAAGSAETANATDAAAIINLRIPNSFNNDHFQIGILLQSMGFVRKMIVTHMPQDSW